MAFVTGGVLVCGSLCLFSCSHAGVALANLWTDVGALALISESDRIIIIIF